jgi:hypothetical protein
MSNHAYCEYCGVILRYHIPHKPGCIYVQPKKRPSARRKYTPPAVVETRKVSFEDVEREYRKALEEMER